MGATFDSSQGQKPVQQASHDTLNPPRLVEFMLQGWRAPRPRRVPAIPGGGASRRAAELSALFPGEMLIVPTGHEKVRSNDTHLPLPARHATSTT